MDKEEEMKQEEENEEEEERGREGDEEAGGVEPTSVTYNHCHWKFFRRNA